MGLGLDRLALIIAAKPLLYLVFGLLFGLLFQLISSSLIFTILTSLLLALIMTVQSDIWSSKASHLVTGIIRLHGFFEVQGYHRQITQIAVIGHKIGLPIGVEFVFELLQAASRKPAAA